MKILVSDALGDAGIEMFEAAEGLTVDVKTGLDPDALRAIIGAYDALVIRSATKVTAELLSAADRLKVVGRAGIGLDNVDIPAATRKGVVVMNTPTGNVVTTAEHAIAMLLALSRNIPQGTGSLKNGRWIKKQLQGREVYQKVLGVIGFGKIGAIVADRARGLKMEVLVHDPFINPEKVEKAGLRPVDLDELYATSDYITVHVPKLKDTAGLIDAAAFERMKNGVMLINCARGGIVDEAALLTALETGKVAGAALDVFETEPPGASPLLDLPQVICTPHLGASTKEAQTNVAVAVAEQIIAYLQKGTIVNAVNAPSVSGARLKKVAPYLSLADALGVLQAQLCQGSIIAVEIAYMGDFNGMDLKPISTAVIKGLLSAVAAEGGVNMVNARSLAEERGITIAETTGAAAADYLNLLTVKVTTTAGTRLASGTLFGKKAPRIVRIDKFRLEMVPKGHMALIHNIDKPGSIGQIGTTLGRHQINIGRMQVGQEEDGDRNIIFMTTDTPIPPAVADELRALSLVKTVTTLEFV
ncbi:MAG: phosphoglycerate dehydrogenase [Desulfosarcinaceae bacterium]|nr:phosphoglycerate dehydrogenase [Desulfosarcinaceae bacterium]